MSCETSPGETRTTVLSLLTGGDDRQKKCPSKRTKGAGVTQRRLIVYSLPQHGENSESCNPELHVYLVGCSPGCRVSVPQQLLAVYTSAGGARLVFLSFSLQRGSFRSVEMLSQHHTPRLSLLTQKQKAVYNFREGLVAVFNIYLICLAGVGGTLQSSWGSERLAGVSFTTRVPGTKHRPLGLAAGPLHYEPSPWPLRERCLKARILARMQVWLLEFRQLC